MSAPARPVATVTDPGGLTVTLDSDGWDHIIAEHPELAGSQAAILAAIVQPDHRRPDPRPGRVRLYRRGVGPSRWLLVVVDYGETPPRVVTAFGTRRTPQGWTPR